MSGAALMLWIAGVHLLGLGCVALLMFPALKDNPVGPDRRPEDGEDGWGRGPKPPPAPPAPPRGGIPLPDAIPPGCACASTAASPSACPVASAGRSASRTATRTRTPHRSGCGRSSARSGWGRSRRSRSAG